ncbi:alpha/beta hydrolase [Nocardioides sp. JQ2195]|nr:alpha/beta hydrolase [Nocardioides sp. JQ2195]
MRYVEQGTGPAVVMCHGFPGLAHSWRHQLPALARAGFRAIAVDMRGYGGTDRPENPIDYDRASTVGDLTGLLDALGLDDAVFVGHDFGAALVWDLPQWAPGRVRALVQLSVPRAKTSPILPSTAFASLARDHFFHMHYFQQYGVADAELTADPGGFLQRVFWALSGGYRYTDIFAHPSEGNGYLDVLPSAPELPWPWLTQEELGHYVETFTSTGFTGGLNWYRAADHIWREKQERPDEPITLPVCFVTGDRDPVQQITGRDSVEAMRASVPGLRETHFLPGIGHFLQMEAPDEVNRIMVDFLRTL